MPDWMQEKPWDVVQYRYQVFFPFLILFILLLRALVQSKRNPRKEGDSSHQTNRAAITNDEDSSSINLFADWEIIGNSFLHSECLTADEWYALINGATVVRPVQHYEDLFWGAVFRFVPDASPHDLAAVWADYNGHKRFVPGMTHTKVLSRNGSVSRVSHFINPLIFLFNEESLTSLLPRWLFEALTFEYELDEQVYNEASRVSGKGSGDAFGIRWTIPVDTQWTMGSRENGEIYFSPAPQGGTIISYNNATEPFHVARLMRAVLPRRLYDLGIYPVCALAGNYYARTVDGLVTLFTSRLTQDEIQNAGNGMWDQLASPQCQQS